MKHEKLRMLVLQLADDVLSEKERALAQKHIAECGRCAEEMELLIKARREFAELPAPQIKPFFAQRIMAQYRASVQERFWTVFRWVPRPLLLAALSLSVMLIFLTIPQSDDNMEATNFLTQLYSSQAPVSLESDDQALAFLVKNEYPSITGEQQ